MALCVYNFGRQKVIIGFHFGCIKFSVRCSEESDLKSIDNIKKSLEKKCNLRVSHVHRLVDKDNLSVYRLKGFVVRRANFQQM